MVTIVIASPPAKVDVLVLGAGWTSTFVIPLLEKCNITYAATTTTGRDGTYKFKFGHSGKKDSASEPSYEDSPEDYAALPVATTVLITFPLKGPHESSHLVNSYTQNHESQKSAYQFIQLGSTGIFSIADQDLWVTRRSKYNESNLRAVAEDHLLQFGGCVLNLSGLWGGARHPRHWIDRVASTKEQLKEKTSLHMIHGEDVARAIIAVHQHFPKATGQRWILTDLFVYDWWALILEFAGELDAENSNNERERSQVKWVGEFMTEQTIRALPRTMEQLGRCYDTREFWETFGLMPVRARI